MISNLDVSQNPFLEPILKKSKRKDFFAGLCLWKILRKMNKISPSFDELIQIWQVVYYANICNMVSYHDGSELHLFLASAKGKSRDDSYAMIYRENNFQIKILLGVEERRISIEIDRSIDRNNPKESITFIDGTYKFTDEIDREKFRFIISSIMNGCKELMVYCYNNKRF